MLDKQSDFARQLHAQFGISSSAMREIMQSATGEDIRSSERIVRGYHNEVYRALTDSGPFILRINRNGDADFRAEAWAMSEVRGVGAPAPEVLLVDNIRDKGEDLSVMVLSVLPGRPLLDVQTALSPAQFQDVLFAVGKMLATVNSIPTPGVWKPEADGSWNTWEDIKDGALTERLSEHPELVSAGLSPAEASSVLELVAYYINEYPWSNPVLCHGDFVPDHIFVDDNLEITGLLDFGMFHGGLQVSDLAYLRFAWPDLEQDTLLAGYGVREDDADFSRRRDLHAVMHAVGYIAASVKMGDKLQAPRYVQTLRSLMQDLQQP